MRQVQVSEYVKQEDLENEMIRQISVSEIPLVAARLEARAQAEGICLTGNVVAHLKALWVDGPDTME